MVTLPDFLVEHSVPAWANAGTSTVSTMIRLRIPQAGSAPRFLRGRGGRHLIQFSSVKY